MGNSLFCKEAETRPIRLHLLHFLDVLKVPAELLLPPRDTEPRMAPGQLMATFSCSASSKARHNAQVDNLLSPFSEAFQQFFPAVCMGSTVLSEFAFQLDTLCYFSIALSRQVKKV